MDKLLHEEVMWYEYTNFLLFRKDCRTIQFYPLLYISSCDQLLLEIMLVILLFKLWLPVVQYSCGMMHVSKILAQFLKH